ncbi:thioredoxin family protein [Phaeodactylibacter luteus]|uniref:Thioredoxin family protein n=1 Tax=Phaeodactylibacter luteus TaxID=1564516 RepID=A0A5C6RW18_9BACT|nr:thioredoxin family protein [Phaeodactylibacter luteus]TXB66234.1 thioredoxin family protein [Phaeodactylibacter luteus]
MALTSSNMIALGTPAPSFSLLDVVSGGAKTDVEVFGEQGTVVMFICNHCPYVLYVNPELCRVAHDYQKQGIGFVAISANDAEQYPQDGPVAMKAHAAEQGYPFPYLYDEQQDVARAYQAACTPDIYVFDSDRALYYRGQLDASRPGQSEPLSGKDLRSALDALLAGIPPPERQYPSAGCNIKWK